MKELEIKDKKLLELFDGEKRKQTEKRKIHYEIPAYLRNSKAQYDLLCRLQYDTVISEKDVPFMNELSKELTKKMNGYKQQDVKRKLFNPDSLITVEKIREKLIDETMTCTFCGCQVLLMFDKVREGKQWTLDRIDNDKGHSYDNTKIACLDCNLKRRRQNYDDFHWTKNLTISKVADDG